MHVVEVDGTDDPSEDEWIRDAAQNPVFAFLNDPVEDGYALTDGKPYRNDSPPSSLWEPTMRVNPLDRITINAKKMNGQPCVRDMRLTVGRVLEALAVFPNRDDLKHQYPGLEDEDIAQALLYAAALLHENTADQFIES